MNILLVFLTVVAMEAMAWLLHKYLMHGLMWHWHESHHTPRKGIFEKNDLFGVIFGAMSATGIIVGDKYEIPSLFWIGIGISVYGVLYFVFHDILVHQRIRFRYRTKNRYLNRIISAHHAHHKVHVRDGAEAFGFLYASKKYEKKT